MYSDSIKIRTESFTTDIQLKSLISVNIGNDSANTAMLLRILEALHNVNKERILESNISIDDIIICTRKRDIEWLLGLHSDYKGKTIIIDRYDLLHSDELNKFIMSGSNRFLIMSHTFYKDLDLHAESFIIIKYNKNTRTFYSEELINHINEYEL
jgi:hypothetical protein